MTMNTWILHLNPLADSWLAAVWRATWQGSLALLLVWAVCRVFHRLPARAKSWLWRLAYLKLLVALLLATPIDLPLLPANTAPLSPPAQFADLLPSLPNLDLPSPAFSVPAQPQLTPAPPAATAEPPAPPRQPSSAPALRILPNAAAWLMLVWALGVAAFGLCAWRGSRRARRLRCACSPVADSSLLQCAAELACSFRLSAVPSLLMSEAICSPLLLGIWRPVIVLPSALVSGSSLSKMRLMIAHEMAHIKRSDLWWIWLAVAGESLFFFHPLLWLVRREWRLTQEMACDEMVVRMTRVPAAAYGDMLVGVAALNLLKRREPFSVTLGLTETKEMLAKRLNAMKLIKSNSTKRMVLATAAILTVSALSVLPWRLTAQEFLAHRLQPPLHLGVIDKVHLFEFVNEPDEAIQCFLVNPRLAPVNALQHVLAELSGLFPERSHAIGHESFDALVDLLGSPLGGLLPGQHQLLVIRHRHHVQAQPLRDCNLERPLQGALFISGFLRHSRAFSPPRFSIHDNNL